MGFDGTRGFDRKVPLIAFEDSIPMALINSRGSRRHDFGSTRSSIEGLLVNIMDTSARSDVSL